MADRSYASIVKQIRGARNHYALLRVARDFTDKELAKARRELALHVHPDLNGTADAHTLMSMVNEAYDTLHKHKAAYDMHLKGPPCVSCRGRGRIEKAVGFTKTRSIVCGNCHGAGVI